MKRAFLPDLRRLHRWARESGLGLAFDTLVATRLLRVDVGDLSAILREEGIDGRIFERRAFDGAAQPLVVVTIGTQFGPPFEVVVERLPRGAYLALASFSALSGIYGGMSIFAVDGDHNLIRRHRIRRGRLYRVPERDQGRPSHRMVITRSVPRRPMVWGDWCQRFIALPGDDARRLTAVMTATTWGELKRRVSPDHYRDLVECRCDERNEPRPGDHFETPDGQSNDFEDPRALMLECLPEEVLALGEVWAVPGGEVFDLGMEHADAALAILSEAGWDCKRDDATVTNWFGG